MASHVEEVLLDASDKKFEEVIVIGVKKNGEVHSMHTLEELDLVRLLETVAVQHRNLMLEALFDQLTTMRN